MVAEAHAAAAANTSKVAALMLQHDDTRPARFFFPILDIGLAPLKQCFVFSGTCSGKQWREPKLGAWCRRARSGGREPLGILWCWAQPSKLPFASGLDESFEIIRCCGRAVGRQGAREGASVFMLASHVGPRKPLQVSAQCTLVARSRA